MAGKENIGSVAISLVAETSAFRQGMQEGVKELEKFEAKAKELKNLELPDIGDTLNRTLGKGSQANRVLKVLRGGGMVVAAATLARTFQGIVKSIDDMAEGFADVNKNAADVFNELLLKIPIIKSIAGAGNIISSWIFGDPQEMLKNAKAFNQIIDNLQKRRRGIESQRSAVGLDERGTLNLERANELKAIAKEIRAVEKDSTKTAEQKKQIINELRATEIEINKLYDARLNDIEPGLTDAQKQRVENDKKVKEIWDDLYQQTQKTMYTERQLLENKLKSLDADKDQIHSALEMFDIIEKRNKEEKRREEERRKADAAAKKAAQERLSLAQRALNIYKQNRSISAVDRLSGAIEAGSAQDVLRNQASTVGPVVQNLRSILSTLMKQQASDQKVIGRLDRLIRNLQVAPRTP